jgi:hypothetical protein
VKTHMSANSSQNDKCFRNICTKNQNKHFVVYNFFFPRKSWFMIMWKNSTELDRATDGNITRRMRFACCIPKATNTHSEYAIIIAFLRQQWLHERASALRFVRTLPVSLNAARLYRGKEQYRNTREASVTGRRQLEFTFPPPKHEF